MIKDLTSVESVHIMKDALNEIKTISLDFSPTKKQTVGNKPHILSLVLEEDFENAQIQVNNLTEWEFNSFTPKYQKRLDRNLI